jgi:hypothetical protein
MDNQSSLGWTLLVAGVVLLIAFNRMDLLTVLLPVSLVLSCTLIGLTSKKSHASVGLKKR